MSQRIRAVSLDVGGTLIQPWPTVGHVYAAAAREAGFASLEPEGLTRRFGEAWKQRKSFGYSRDEWQELVQATFAGQLPSSAICDLFPLLYQRFAEAAAWRIFEDVLPAIEQLKSRGLRLAITSNWDERLTPTLHSLGLLPHFEVVVASGPIGHHKPSPTLFRILCAKLGLPPAEVLHVGDSRSEDLEGALCSGLAGLHLVRSTPRPGPEEISTLLAVPDWLDRW